MITTKEGIEQSHFRLMLLNHANFDFVASFSVRVKQ